MRILKSRTPLNRLSGRFIEMKRRAMQISGAAALCVVAFAVQAFAEEIILQNGDRITGNILSDDASVLTIQSDALGTLSIDRAFVQAPAYNKEGLSGSIQEAEEQKQHAVEWARKLSIGYQKTGGNTDKNQLNSGVDIKRKTDSDEWAGNASLYYSSADNKMDAQKSYGSLRYSYFFGDAKAFHHFYKLEADHDRFANIDYRLLPSTGIGYWFSGQEKYKFMQELAIGHEHTAYRNNIPRSRQTVIMPRVFYNKNFFKDFWTEIDFIMYVPMDSFDQYRLRSENSIVYLLTERLSWRLSLINEYNAVPAADAEKNDYRVIYALEYGF